MLGVNKANLQLTRLNESDPHELNLIFKLTNDVASAEFTPDQKYEGYPGYIHQGIIAVIMDDAMGWLARNGAGICSVTAKMEICLFQLPKVGETIRICAKISKNSKKLLREIVKMESKEGVLFAKGTCVQYIIGEIE